MLEHLPLGYGALASAPAPCDDVLQLAGLARTQGGRLAYARRPMAARVALSPRARSGLDAATPRSPAR